MCQLITRCVTDIVIVSCHFSLVLVFSARLFVGRLEAISASLAAWSKEQLEMKAEGSEISLEFLQKMVNLVG
jgi:hypothetical protein